MVSNAYMIDSMDVNVLDVFDSGSDVEALYSGGSDVGAIYAHTETIGEVIHKRHSDFDGTWDDMRYIPTAVGGSATSPILELAWTETIDEMVGTIDSASGVIDRPDTDGNYISQYLTVGAATFDKIYWNEVMPTQGGDITLNVRAGATTTDCGAAKWMSSEFSNSNGSDISDVTADTVAQYRITMTTNDITVTPTIVLADNFNVKLIYDTVGSAAETSIPIKWRGGWENFGAPSRAKTLKKLYVFYDWNADTTGTLNLTFENYLGDTDTFAIDLYDNPSYYIDYFTDMAFTGNVIRMTIEEDSLNPITIKKVIIVYDVQPITYKFPN